MRTELRTGLLTTLGVAALGVATLGGSAAVPQRPRSTASRWQQPLPGSGSPGEDTPKPAQVAALLLLGCGLGILLGLMPQGREGSCSRNRGSSCSSLHDGTARAGPASGAPHGPSRSSPRPQPPPRPGFSPAGKAARPEWRIGAPRSPACFAADDLITRH